MSDPTLNRAALRNKFELEKFRSKVVKSLPEVASATSGNQKKKATDIEEIVKHMKHLPSYLEKGKPIPDRALSFGVMDWALLEKWQHRNHKQGFIKSSNNNCSPSSSNSSSLFSTDGSSPRSSRDQSNSPRQKVHRVTLQSHFQDIKPTPAETNANSSKNSKTELDSPRNKSSPVRNKTPERITSSSAGSKSRSMSPLRRFSFSHSTSASPKPESPISQKSTRDSNQGHLSPLRRLVSPISQKSTRDSNRGHSSPLRRLLDPIFPSKTHPSAETWNENSRTKAKVKLDFRKSKEIRTDDVSFSSSWKQALFQTTVKYDRLLFTFAVENNKDILAATVTSVTSSAKDDDSNNHLLYTFFTVHEVKNKNGNWLSQATKSSKDHGYVPNVTAQMKVSNSHCDTRESVLYSVNSNVQPQEELEAIVVKSSQNVNNGNISNQERFETTVILPGGIHSVPIKGEPSPLIDRWRSGGVCDCGGWDVGCRLKTLANQTSDKAHMTTRHELFFQGEVKNKRPIFSLSPLKEGIYSVDYNSSLSPLQAFSICISVVESQKTSQNTELRKHIHEEAPVIYTRIPRIIKNTTGNVGFM